MWWTTPRRRPPPGHRVLRRKKKQQPCSCVWSWLGTKGMYYTAQNGVHSNGKRNHVNLTVSAMATHIATTVEQALLIITLDGATV